jgi:ubiquitin C-terminal hydrolase
VDDELKPRKATNSVMMDLFGVDQYQEVQCDECKTVTKRTEPLLGLVLSLPDKDDIKAGKTDEDTRILRSHSNIGAVDLLDCFKSLQTTGRFVGENQFDCDVCRAKKDAEWRVTLHRRPQSLLISLRRTLWNKEKGLHKDSRRVNFPIELDASDLLGVGEEKSPDDDFEGCHYKLVAVVSHSGSSPFVGHYISYVRSSDKWFLFNDSSVTPASDSSVLEAEAFILLYERQTLPSVTVNNS